MCKIVDFHTHILPNIDDGSASLQESIEMLKMEAAQGIEHVVATPHFYAQYDSPEVFLTRRARAVERLREEMEKHRNMPILSVGAEVLYFPGMCHSELLSELTIDEGACILIEMPNAPWTNTMYRELVEIRNKQGLLPIVAHVDRYIRPFHTYHIPERLEELPVLVQANASFFLQKKTEKMALKMIRNDRIHLVGSDCHNTTTRRPNLQKALDVISRTLSSEVTERIQFYQDTALRGLINE